jgi:Uma2 family endonuclease
MKTSDRVFWTSADLDLLPDNGNRYEIIEGELWITRLPHWNHQRTCGNILVHLDHWSDQSQLGQSVMSPGVIFSEIDDIIPDVVWISNDRLNNFLDDAGHLLGAPEIVIEVLSPGTENERRDRSAKRKLYSTRGVQEYWIANWQLQQIEIYRRENAILTLNITLLAGDILTSPLLPGFSCRIQQLFE